MPLHLVDGTPIPSSTPIPSPAVAAPQVVVQTVTVPGPQGPPGIQGEPGGTVIPAAQSQVTWHINESTGDNTADGLTTGTAVHDMDEIIRRVGTKWRLDTTVHIYLDTAITKNILVSASLAANGRIVFHGKSTVLRTGTISAFAPENMSSESTLITQAAATWVAGTKIRTTTGSHPGAWCWVAKDKGSGVARTSLPGTLNYLTDPLNTSQVSLSAGDTFNVESQCVVSSVTFDLDGGVGNSQNLSQVVFLDCDFVNIAATFVPVTFVGCKFRFAQIGRVANTNCCFTSILIGIASTGSDSGLFLNIFLFVQYEGQWFFNSHPVFQGAKPVAKPSALLFFEDYAAFYDIANPLEVVYGAKIFVRHGVWGSGITQAAIKVDAGGQFRWNGTVFSFIGNTYDVTLGGKTQLPRMDPVTMIPAGDPLDLSFANLFNPYVSGGFGGSAHDLYSNASFLQVPDSAF